MPNAIARATANLCRTPAETGPTAIACIAAAALVLLVDPANPKARPLFVWNASPSSPRGLYLVGDRALIRRGDMVVAWAPATARRLAAERDYLPSTVPLVKPVAAASGDRICVTASVVTINGRLSGVRRRRDRQGRRLPAWFGCHRLERGEVFLLSRNAPLAFDGRYFGPTQAREIIGKAHLLWPS